QHPSWEVLNYGTPGYGTYQCLLTLERVLPKLSSPSLVIYGFLEHHLVRNIAPPSWRAVLNRDRRQKIYIPYVSVDQNGALVRHPAALYKQWPLSHSMAIVKFAEVMWLATHESLKDNREMDAAWQLILIEIRDLCIRHGCRFVVALFPLAHQNEKQFYINFFKLNNIEFVDCDIALSKEFLLEKDPSHPNTKANKIWAEVIGKAL
ncbi:MAG: hypothetical protein ACOZBW_14625, partial [Thermodesulfobacteriota bacterium]